MSSKSNHEKLERIFVEEGRLMILDILNRSNAYSANEIVLQKALELFGFAWSTLALRKELDWLEGQRMVDMNNVEELLVIKITNIGLESLSGTMNVEGLSRPRPERD